MNKQQAMEWLHENYKQWPLSKEESRTKTCPSGCWMWCADPHYTSTGKHVTTFFFVDMLNGEFIDDDEFYFARQQTIRTDGVDFCQMIKELNM